MSQYLSNTAFAANTSSFSANTAFNDNTPSNRSVVPQILPPDALIPQPQVDPAAIEHHCKLLFKLTDGLEGLLPLAWQFCDPKFSKPQFRFEMFDTRVANSCENMVRIAVELAARPYTNVYFGTYLARYGTWARGTRDDIIASLMLGVDQDFDKKKGGRLPMPASLAIRTSSDPNENAQAFYVPDPKNRWSIEEADALGKALRKFTCSDLATGDIVHMYRMPGSLNWPTSEKLKRGRPSGPQACFVTQSFGGYVDVPKLSLVLEGVPPEEVGKSIPPFDGDLGKLVDNLPSPFKELLQRSDIKSDRSEAAWAALRKLVEANYTKPEVKSLVLAFPAGVGARYLSDHAKLDAEIHRAFAKVNTAPQWVDVHKSGKILPTYANALLGLRKLGVEFMYDEFRFRQLVNYSPLGLECTEIDDGVVSRVREAFRLEFKFDPSLRAMFEAVQYLCQEGRFHPIRDYLDSLKWDGKCRLSTWLHVYMSAEHNAYTSSAGLIMMVAAVRRIYEPGTKFDTILVLEGGQGTGKSSALVVLAGKDNHSDNEILATDIRSQLEAMEGIWLYEIGELSGMRKAEIGKIKAFASRSVDSGRPAYARYSERRPRQCVFIGTTNDDEYLRDPTGNRRFLPVKTRQIDLKALERDRDQLWAEAVHWHGKGEPITLPEELWQFAAREQDQRIETDPWEDRLSSLGALVQLSDDHTMERVSSDAILELLEIPLQQRHSGHFKRVAAIMRRFEWSGPKSIRFRKTFQNPDDKSKFVAQDYNVKGYERPTTEETLACLHKSKASASKSADERQARQNGKDKERAAKRARANARAKQASANTT